MSPQHIEESSITDGSVTSQFISRPASELFKRKISKPRAFSVCRDRSRMKINREATINVSDLLVDNSTLQLETQAKSDANNKSKKSRIEFSTINALKM